MENVIILSTLQSIILIAGFISGLTLFIYSGIKIFFLDKEYYIKLKKEHNINKVPKELRKFLK